MRPDQSAMQSGAPFPLRGKGGGIGAKHTHGDRPPQGDTARAPKGAINAGGGDSPKRRTTAERQTAATPARGSGAREKGRPRGRQGRRGRRRADARAKGKAHPCGKTERRTPKAKRTRRRGGKGAPPQAKRDGAGHDDGATAQKHAGVFRRRCPIKDGHFRRK
jgi:hypothetical protein